MELYVMFAGVLALIVLANVVLMKDNPTLNSIYQLLLLGINLVPLAYGAMLLFTPLAILEQAEMVQMGFDVRNAGLWSLLTGVFGGIIVLPFVRRWLANVTPLDPKNMVHATALLLAMYLVGNTLSTLGQGGLDALADTVSSVSILDVIGSQLLFALAGLAGVGWLIRRDRQAIFKRLGLERPTGIQWLWGISLVPILVIAQLGVGIIAQYVSPNDISAIEDINSVLLGNMDSIGEWFLLAVAAGVCEELLFRGALQPIFGLPLTAIVFTIAHVQYGFTIVTVFFVFLAVVLGLIRHYMNTTVAIFVHFSYDFALGLLALLAAYLEPYLPEMIVHLTHVVQR